MSDIRKTRRPGLRTDPDIAEAARRLAQSGDDWTAAGIHRRLLEDHPEWRPRMPTVRSIQNTVRGLMGSAADPWSFSVVNPEDGAIVLGLLGDLWDVGIRPQWPTVDEAGYIVRLRRAFPDLDAARTLALARAYLSAADGSNIYTLVGLDRYLAFAPWRDGAARYIQALVEGYIHESFGMPGDPTAREVGEVLKRSRRPEQTLEETGKRVRDDVAAGRNPFLNGRPYREENEQ